MSNIKTALPGKPVERDIIVIRNDTFIYPIRGWAENGDPYDFTGLTFGMQVKKKREEGEEAIIDIPDEDFSVDQDDRGEADGVQNILIIEHAAENMDIEPGDYVYDIQLEDAAGKVQTFQKEINYFRVEQDVTQ